MAEPVVLRRFRRPYNTGDMDETIRVQGAAIALDVISADLCTRSRAEIDRWLDDHPAATDPVAGISRGPHTVRLHSLLNKVASASEVVAHPDILGWARRMLAPRSTQVLLSAAEYLERTPGEERRQEVQGLHRGTESWPRIPIGAHPVMVHAIVALAPFTVGNGAMWLAMNSQWLPDDEHPHPRTMVQAIMDSGDAVLFRSDLIHTGGVNPSPDQRRRSLSIGYQVDWLRPVENGTLNVPSALAARYPIEVQELLGYCMDTRLGRYEAGDPKAAIDHVRRHEESR
jgi:hypothetical protein